MRRNGNESNVMGTLHIKNQTLTIVLSLSLYIYIYMCVCVCVCGCVCVCVVCLCSVRDVKVSVIAGFNII